MGTTECAGGALLSQCEDVQRCSMRWAARIGPGSGEGKIWPDDSWSQHEFPDSGLHAPIHDMESVGLLADFDQFDSPDAYLDSPECPAYPHAMVEAANAIGIFAEGDGGSDDTIDDECI